MLQILKISESTTGDIIRIYKNEGRIKSKLTVAKMRLIVTKI